MICCRKKRILSGCIVGVGVGIILVLFLPLTAWLFILGIGLIVGGIGYLFGN